MPTDALHLDDARHSYAAETRLGFGPRLQSHCYQRAHEHRREELASDGLGHGKRAGVACQGRYVAKSDRGQSGKTEVAELRGKFVNICRRVNEMKRAGMQVFDELFLEA